MEERARGAITRTMGETVTYRPLAGGSYAVRGVFSHQLEVQDAETGASLNSNQPNLFVSRSALSADPVRADEFDRDADHGGESFRVEEIERDGEGGVLLICHEAAA